MHKPKWRFLFVVAAIVGASNTQAQPQSGGNGPIVSQTTLDFMVGFPLPATPAKPGLPYLPVGPFASCMDDQKHTVPSRISGICSFLWIMSHDDPATRFLPSSLPEADEEELGIDLCLAGHMPADWPDWQAKLQGANAILERAAQAGSPFKLPSAL